MPDLPAHPPFALRARLLTPLGAGGFRYETDARIEVDDTGRLASVAPWAARPAAGPQPAAAHAETVVDLRPWVVLPGMVDLHLHLPQLPNAGLGAGLDLLTWLDRYIFPLEREFDRSAAERLAPLAFRAMAAAGTTTALMYGAVFEPSLDAAFEAAEAHGIRAVIGKVMMDRLRYDPALAEADVLETSLRQSADLIGRWHGRDNGRLRYAVTPRFAVSCSAEMLRESAALAARTGAYWQTHLAEDRNEIAEVQRLFPGTLDYTDVYDRAGGLGPRTVMAHAIHLSDREIGRLSETETRIAHCPSSNLFLASGTMRLGRYLEAGLVVGLGSDVSAGPDLSLFGVMRAGAYTQSGLRTMLDEPYAALAPMDWLRLGSLEGAHALGLDAAIGSIEVGKEADLIAVDTALTAPMAGVAATEPEEIASRLIFRSHPDMVRAAWVRGRRLEGPPGA
ncbi:MAG: guanine deaminase [Chloroflexi bacterium]|nr:MAG: guanine deaminase [Chloroflexota bacterium]